MARVLLITEKPGISENVLEGLNKVILDGKEVDTVFVYPISWWQWKIAKKTPLRKIPATPNQNDMSLRLHPTMDVVPYGQISDKNGQTVICKRSGYTVSDFRNIILDRWDEYEKVVCIPEDDRNGWGSLIRWFKWLTEVDESILIGKDVRCLRPEDFSVEAVEKSYNEAIGLGSDYIGEMGRQFEFKHLFDAWFNLNSATAFGIAQNKANIDNSQIVTKYELMTLHAIKKSEGIDLKVHDILKGMKTWSGSGKYKAKPDQDALLNAAGKFAAAAFENKEHNRESPGLFSNIGIGTDASRGSIIQKLLGKEMIQEDDSEIVNLTEKGNKFLSRCHNGTFDPDLPFRLEKWIKGDDLESVKRYIRRYFSRQKRFVI